MQAKPCIIIKTLTLANLLPLYLIQGCQKRPCKHFSILKPLDKIQTIQETHTSNLKLACL